MCLYEKERKRSVKKEFLDNLWDGGPSLILEHSLYLYMKPSTVR